MELVSYKQQPGSCENSLTLTMTSNNPVAVAIRSGFKSFQGSNKQDVVQVLKNFCMTVPSGYLYTLLGSSGCGKTTLLSLIVGIRKLDHGRISVFGNETLSGSQNSKQQIGYMPQETSLYSSFSIYETLVYFSQLFDTGVKKHGQLCLDERIEQLRNLLLLPSTNRIVGTLSGGQRRRVSLMVALINEPELLLLDEPTTGVDPLMREIIWKHLKYLTACKNTTIILTTHFVDEAKHSNIVGIMRNGCLIAEENPVCLMNRLEKDSLEEVFLKLSAIQEQGSSKTFSALGSNISNNYHTVFKNTNEKLNRQSSISVVKNQVQSSSRRIMAFTRKNCRLFIRNQWMAYFTIAWPIMQLMLCLSSVKHYVHDLSLGVVNHDVTNNAHCWQNYSLKGCQLKNLSCNFLQNIPEHTIKMKFFDSTAQARKAVKSGKAWGYIEFPYNYTQSVINRNAALQMNQETAGRNLLEEEFWNNSNIYVSLDQTNTIIYRQILYILYTTFQNSAKQILRDCGFDERNADFSLQFKDALSATMVDFLAPGYITALLYIFALLVAIRIINEKQSGTMVRSLAGGAQLWEVLIGFAIPEVGITILQVLISYSTVHFGFLCGPAPFKEPILVLTILSGFLLIGLFGIACGLLLGTLAEKEMQAAIFIVATTFPSAVLSGALWPLEGLPPALKYPSLAFPVMWALDATRSLMNRRWNLLHPQVWPGFAIPAVATLLTFLLTIGIARLLRK